MKLTRIVEKAPEEKEVLIENKNLSLSGGQFIIGVVDDDIYYLNREEGLFIFRSICDSFYGAYGFTKTIEENIQLLLTKGHKVYMFRSFNDAAEFVVSRRKKS
jgi:hypothetical protein